MDLNTLLIPLEELDDQEVEELGRRIYAELYLDNATLGVRLMHTGEEVLFWADRFDHACFKATGWRTYSHEKNAIDRGRVARLRWIGEVVAGKVPNSACWQVEHGYKPPNLIYVVNGFNYLVWVESTNKGGWK